MDTNRMKQAAQWYYSHVFEDEAIRPRPVPQEERLPSLLRTARSLENAPDRPWQSRESIFQKQGKLLANYEDDYSGTCNVVRYFPTYQALTDQELRCYFSWRTKLRRGDVQKTALSFAFLYIYELLNQIGVDNPMGGYRKLEQFRDAYGPLDGGILSYLDRWMMDYVVYYDLDANLLAGSRQVLFDRSITILDNIRHQEPEKVMFALTQLAPKWLARSKFYAANRDDCDEVIVNVLRRVSDHYDARCKKSMAEQYFGKCSQYQTRLFDSAVFCDPLKRRCFEYAVDERCVYRCQNGLWTVTKHPGPLHPSGKLEDLIKTIDAILREEFAYKHPVKYETETKWLVKIIREEAQALLAKKQAAEAKKLKIDYSQLEKIRSDAAVTQEKLIVEEELETEHAEPPEEIATPACALARNGISSPSGIPDEDTPLDAAEYRLLQCLLYGKDYAWVQAEGFLLSVLVDSINEKLYDTFLDSVLDDTPELIEDYIEDLKEMVRP